MNYNVLRYFSVLASVEHYTIAAARLGISQPSLSSAIHNLEAELGGVKLFEKAGRNIRLTDEGRFYQEKVDAALNELHSASLLLRDSKISAPVVIRMGFVSGVSGSFHSPPGVLFTFPSQYCSTIGHQSVFRLGGWAPHSPYGFHVSVGTQDTVG